MKVIKFILFMFCIVMSSIMFATPKKMNYCLDSNPSGFDVRGFGNAFTLVVLAQIYEPLIRYNSATKQLEPALATSWNVSDDGLVYTFNLRKGVKFQTTSYFKPTRDFNADDVLFSINSQIDNSSPYSYYGNDKWLDSMGWRSLLKEVRKVDDYTVQFILNEKRATFLLESTMYQSDVLSKEYADKLLKQKDITLLSKYPVGTGAYKFVSYLKDSAVSLQNHSDYWGDKAKIERLNFVIEPDRRVVVSKIVNGECDYAGQLESSQVNQMRALQRKSKIGNVAIIPTPLSSMTSVFINVVHNPVLSNVDVRKAILYAIDYEVLYNTTFSSDLKIASSGVPSNVLGWSDIKPVRTQNITRAKELLNSSGIPLSRMSFTYLTRPNNQESLEFGKLLKTDLARIGVTLNIESDNWTVLLDKVYSKGDFDLVELSWLADIPDASNFLSTQFSCASVGISNPAFYCNAEFDELGKKAMATNNQTERNKYFEQQQKIVNIVDVAQIPLAEPIEYEFANTDRLNIKSIKRRYIVPQFKDFELKK